MMTASSSPLKFASSKAAPSVPPPGLSRVSDASAKDGSSDMAVDEDAEKAGAAEVAAEKKCHDGEALTAEEAALAESEHSKGGARDESSMNPTSELAPHHGRDGTEALTTPHKGKTRRVVEGADVSSGLELSFEDRESPSSVPKKTMAASGKAQVKLEPEDPEEQKNKRGKKKGQKKGDVWCAGCAQWKAPDQYMVNQKYCTPCKRLLDRIGGQAKRQGQESWFHDQKGNDKHVKSMLDHMRRLVDSAAPNCKKVKFSVATFEEVQKAEDRTLYRDGGQMMWEREAGMAFHSCLLLLIPHSRKAPPQV